MTKLFKVHTFYVFRINLILSLVISLIGYFLSPPINEKVFSVFDIVYLFMVSFLTGGYLTGIMLFDFSRKREYYIFYNLGISKLKLLSITYLFHIAVAVIIAASFYYAKLLIS